MASGDIPWISYEGDGGAFRTKHTGLRTVVGLTCSLSALGSLLIIFSYVCFKQLRSRPREILMHIALMDLGVSLANLIGDAVYFDQYYHSSVAGNSTLVPATLSPAQLHSTTVELSSSTETGPERESFSVSSYIGGLCKAQAFFAAYFTLGSVFWTVFLGLYIYLLLQFRDNSKVPTASLIVSYFFSYTFPLLISLWLVLTHRLGFAPYNSSGWCSLIIKDPSTGDANLFVAVFANDLWIYLATVLILIFYVTSHIHIHWLMDVGSRREFRSLVYKFLFIPVVFVLLRLWTSILNILYVYVGLEEKQVPFWINETLVYLAGIGDSGQGFANAILFVFFSRKVRSGFWRCLRCRRQVIDITMAPPNSFDGESPRKCAVDSFEETSHLLCRSLENGSLLIENVPYGSTNADSVRV